MTPFPELLRAYRERARLSSNQLATLAAVDHSYVSRLEQAQRDPPRAHVVLAFARILQLDPVDTGRLMVAAGHAPGIAVDWDLALQSVADVLRELTDDERVTFREQLAHFCNAWTPITPRPATPPPLSLRVGRDPAPRVRVVVAVQEREPEPVGAPTPTSGPSDHERRIRRRQAYVLPPISGERACCCRGCGREFGVDLLRSWADESLCDGCVS